MSITSLRTKAAESADSSAVGTFTVNTSALDSSAVDSSALDASALETEAPVLTWSSPESRLWVASANGEYAGMVEFASGHFVATDRTSRDLGGFSSLPAAKEAVTHAGPAPVPLPYVAAVVGTVAVSLASMSLAALAA